MKKHLQTKIDRLNKNEKIVLRALDREAKILSSKKVLNEEERDIPTPEEVKKMEQMKYDREIKKYDDDLTKMRKNAQHIQNAALRVKTNNRIIHSRLLDIQETDRLVSQKNQSIEESIYRLLVRVNEESKS